MPRFGQGDEAGVSAPVDLAVEIWPVNHAPVAVNDQAATTADVPIPLLISKLGGGQGCHRGSSANHTRSNHCVGDAQSGQISHRQAAGCSRADLPGAVVVRSTLPVFLIEHSGQRDGEHRVHRSHCRFLAAVLPHRLSVRVLP